MEIFINGTNIDFKLENEKTIGEVLGQLEKACEQDGMTITSVKTDGRNLSPEELDAFFLKEIDSVKNMEIETLSGKEVLLIAKEKGALFCDIAEKLENIPVLLQTGKEIEAMKSLELFSSEMQKLKTILPLLPLAGIDEDKLLIEGLNPGEYAAGLFPFLEEITKAIEQNDTVTIGDIAEYEIAPRVAAISKFLAEI